LLLTKKFTLIERKKLGLLENFGQESHLEPRLNSFAKLSDCTLLLFDITVVAVKNYPV
jgi:hypothetical protein